MGPLHCLQDRSLTRQESSGEQPDWKPGEIPGDAKARHILDKYLTPAGCCLPLLHAVGGG